MGQEISRRHRRADSQLPASHTVEMQSPSLNPPTQTAAKAIFEHVCVSPSPASIHIPIPMRICGTRNTNGDSKFKSTMSSIRPYETSTHAVISSPTLESKTAAVEGLPRVSSQQNKRQQLKRTSIPEENLREETNRKRGIAEQRSPKTCDPEAESKKLSNFKSDEKTQTRSKNALGSASKPGQGYGQLAKSMKCTQVVMCNSPEAKSNLRALRDAKGILSPIRHDSTNSQIKEASTTPSRSTHMLSIDSTNDSDTRILQADGLSQPRQDRQRINIVHRDFKLNETFMTAAAGTLHKQEPKEREQEQERKRKRKRKRTQREPEPKPKPEPKAAAEAEPKPKPKPELKSEREGEGKIEKHETARREIGCRILSSTQVSTFAPKPQVVLPSPQSTPQLGSRIGETMSGTHNVMGRPTPLAIPSKDISGGGQSADPSRAIHRNAFDKKDRKLHEQLPRSQSRQEQKHNEAKQNEEEVSKDAKQSRKEAEHANHKQHSKHTMITQRRNQSVEAHEHLFHIKPLAQNGYDYVQPNIVREVNNHNDEHNIARELKAQRATYRVHDIQSSESIPRSDAEKRRVWVGKYGRFSNQRLKSWFAGVQYSNSQLS